MQKLHYFHKNSYLDLLRAGMWRIDSGFVRATTYADDSSLVTLGFWGAGDVVGNTLFRSSDYQLECLSVVRASPLIAPSCFLGEISTIESRVIFSHVEQLQELLMIRSCKRIENKLLKLLVWLGNRFGTPEETGTILSVVMTHQDLAETVGSTRVSITRAMKDLERQGIIRHIPQRQLLIDTTKASIDPVPQQLFEKVALSSRHGAMVPRTGVTPLNSTRSFINSY
jgi:CRP-like cAMP-binding protein